MPIPDVQLRPPATSALPRGFLKLKPKLRRGWPLLQIHQTIAQIERNLARVRAW
jgi:hypothetical protein